MTNKKALTNIRSNQLRVKMDSAMLVFCVVGKMYMFFSKVIMSMDHYAASANGHCIMFVCFNMTIKCIA